MKTMFLAVLAALTMMTASAQDKPKFTMLQRSETIALWNQHNGNMQANAVGPLLKQGPMVIQVSGQPVGGPVVVDFFTAVSLPSGTITLFQLILPDGTRVPLNSYQLMGGGDNGVHYQLWNGAFPDIWPAGETRFGVMLVLPSGQIWYTSAVVPIHSCCQLYGPIEKVDVVNDSQIVVIGLFGKETVAMIDGMPVGMIYAFTSDTSPSVATINVGGKIGDGQHNLVICSNLTGDCSTRVIYIKRSGGSGKG